MKLALQIMFLGEKLFPILKFLRTEKIRIQIKFLKINYQCVVHNFYTEQIRRDFSQLFPQCIEKCVDAVSIQYIRKLRK